MPRDNLGDLLAFVAVARQRSFTKAAAILGVSQSALSRVIRGLETRLGLRLLIRTTRNVSLTAAGERLLQSVKPNLEAISATMTALTELRGKPAGTIRITTSDHAADTVLWPALTKFLPRYPDIKIELSTDYSKIDIAEHGFDAGVRLGEALAQGMIAVRIGPDFRFAAVASPSYFAERPLPQTPQDLLSHICINFRLPTYGGLYAWEFEKGGKELSVKVEGQLTFNTLQQVANAAVAGFGIGYVPLDLVQAHVDKRRLIHVLEDWSPPFSGYHLYYSSRRHSSPAFALLIEALRYRGD